MLASAEPLLHWYDAPPFAIRVAEFPLHTLRFPLMVAVGLSDAVTLVVA